MEISANFRPQHCWEEEWGNDEMNPKPNKKLSLGAVLGPLRSPPTPSKVEFCAKRVEMSAFFTTTLLGGVGGRRDEPKAEQKMVIRSRLLRNNYLEGLKFHTAPSSFVLHCSFPHLRSIITSICIWTKIPMRRLVSSRRR